MGRLMNAIFGYYFFFLIKGKLAQWRVTGTELSWTKSMPSIKIFLTMDCEQGTVSINEDMMVNRVNSVLKGLCAAAAATAAKSLQFCPILCDPIDGSPPSSPIPGILQARTLEWVSISFSSAWKWKVKVKSLSGVRLFVIPWTAAHQAPPSEGFSRQEHWSRVPLPSPSAAAGVPVTPRLNCFFGLLSVSVD